MKMVTKDHRGHTFSATYMKQQPDPELEGVWKFVKGDKGAGNWYTQLNFAGNAASGDKWGAKLSFSRTTNSRAIEGNWTQSNGYHGQFTATWEEVTDKGHVMKMVTKDHRGHTFSATYMKQQPDPPLQSAPQAAIDKGSDDGVALTRNLFSSLSPSAVVKLQGAMGPVVTDLVHLRDEDLDALGQTAGLDTPERSNLVNAAENTRKTFEELSKWVNAASIDGQLVPLAMAKGVTCVQDMSALTDDELKALGQAAGLKLVERLKFLDAVAKIPKTASAAGVAPTHEGPTACVPDSGAKTTVTPASASVAAVPAPATEDSTHARRPAHMVAFVVGIGDYKHYSKLRNPVSDAEAVRDRLQDQNAEVFFARDCGIKALEEEFALFVAAVRPGDTAFLFFACHGVVLNNSLRLIAISNSSTPDIEKESMNLDMLLARIAMKNPCLITGFFDCCRVHAPSASQHTAGAGRSIVKKLILYACDRNSEASDGKGKHGVFTGCLLTHLTTPNLELGKLVMLVIKDVEALRGEIQSPFREDNLSDKWCLFTNEKYLSRPSHIDTLREQLRVLKARLKDIEADCRTTLDGLGIEGKYVDAMIREAPSGPQKKAHPALQSIYRYSQAVQEMEQQVRDTNGR